MATYYDDQEIDSRPGHYYVSVIDGPRHVFVLGPFETHVGALLRVNNARRRIPKLINDVKAPFFAYGTARIELQDNPPQGKLNGLL